MKKLLKKGSPVRFILIFLALFLLLYLFNLVIFSLTNKGSSHYSAFVDTYFDYISALRHFLLRSTALILNWLGYASVTNDTTIKIAGHGGMKLIYSCLGLGIMSFLTAFVIAYPKTTKQKLVFLLPALIILQLLNVLRFVILGIFWDKNERTQVVDQHAVFNIIIYILIAVCLYFWVKRDERKGLNQA